MAFQFGSVQVHRAVFHLHGELRRAAFIGRGRLAVAQAYGPVVQRAGHAGAEDDALAQRAALVRAMVLDREDAVVGGPEHADVARSLASLALLYDSQGRHTLSEPLHERALAIRG